MLVQGVGRLPQGTVASCLMPGTGGGLGLGSDHYETCFCPAAGGRGRGLEEDPRVWDLQQIRSGSGGWGRELEILHTLCRHHCGRCTHGPGGVPGSAQLPLASRSRHLLLTLLWSRQGSPSPSLLLTRATSTVQVC